MGAVVCLTVAWDHYVPGQSVAGRNESRAVGVCVGLGGIAAAVDGLAVVPASAVPAFAVERVPAFAAGRARNDGLPPTVLVRAVEAFLTVAALVLGGPSCALECPIGKRHPVQALMEYHQNTVVTSFAHAIAHSYCIELAVAAADRLARKDWVARLDPNRVAP